MRCFRLLVLAPVCLALSLPAVAAAQSANPANVTLRMTPENAVDVGGKGVFSCHGETRRLCGARGCRRHRQDVADLPQSRTVGAVGGRDVNFIKPGDELQVPSAAAGQRGSSTSSRRRRDPRP